jgi:A/G-specific adenine glycosylase
MPRLLKALKKVELRDFPWRRTRDPYKILMSEIMLQQTQVGRVVPFYTRFVRQFPTPQALARAPLSKVLQAWQGLGYNRRAQYLKRSAKILSETKLLEKTVWPARPPRRGRRETGDPRTFSQGAFVQHLPGIGPYTAAAVRAFAFNEPAVFIETNIRTVFLYYFFPTKKQVSDKEILPFVEQAFKKSKLPPREFYWRLMDYGAELKRQGIRLNNRSKHYAKQSKFEGSRRQKRAARLRTLLASGATEKELEKALRPH